MDGDENRSDMTGAHLVRAKYKRLEGIAKFLIQEGVKYGIARAVPISNFG
jgi:hypothetical protein